VWPEWFKGRLDEIRVYDRALSPAQIQADMAAPINTSVPRLERTKRARGGAVVKRYRGH
jgi:hypothetical protein